MSKVLLIATLGALGAQAACGGSESTPTEITPTGPFVRATTSNVFSPVTLTVAVGDTVAWVFGAVEHDVVFATKAGVPNNIGLTRNKNVTRVFNTAGTFTYECSVHAGMTGNIVAQ